MRLGEYAVVSTANRWGRASWAVFFTAPSNTERIQLTSVRAVVAVVTGEQVAGGKVLLLAVI